MATSLACDPRGTISARVRQLLDKPRRTASEDEEMLHAAHAHRHYVGQSGTLTELIRAERSCAYVYVQLGRAEPALYHARRGLALSSSTELEPLDRAHAYEAVARAHAVAGEREESRGYEWLARRIGMQIADADDRDRLLAELAAIAMLRRIYPPSHRLETQPADDDRDQRRDA